MWMSLSQLNEAALARLLAGRGNRSEFVDLSKKEIDKLCAWVDEERKRRDRQVNYYEALEEHYAAICKNNKAVLARVLAGHGNRGEFVGLSKKQIDEFCKWVDEKRERCGRQVNYYEACEKYYPTICKNDPFPRRIGMACRAWKGTQYMRSVETKARRADEDRLKRQAEEERLKRQASSGSERVEEEEQWAPDEMDTPPLSDSDEDVDDI